MNSEIDKFKLLIQLINTFQQVNQLSWAADQTKKRYPFPEALTEKEIDQLIKVYLALGERIFEINREWKKIIKEYGHQN